MKKQFITDNQGNKLAVIIPIKTYQNMIEELEDMEDVRLYDKAKKGPQKFIDAEQAFREIEENRNKMDV